MKVKILLLFTITATLFISKTRAQKISVNGVLKSQIFFNESQFSLGTALDGIVGNTEILSRTGDVYLSTDTFRTNSLIVKNTTGNVGIGTTTPQAKLDVNGNIFTSGKIAIGTTDTSKIGTYSLAVDGDAIFNKVKVRSYTSWPDYVFYKNYQLPPLDDLETFIKLNNHLPDVPSASDIKVNGVDVESNQAILLKKVEKLTLYTIDLNKRLEQLQKIIEEQNHKIAGQNKMISQSEIN